jgi:Cys-rich repeat protein
MKKFVLVLMVNALLSAGTNTWAQVDIGRAPAIPSDPLYTISRPEGGYSMPMAGAQAFAVDVYPGYNLVNIPDTDVPGTWTVVASQPGNTYFAGDFINGDFSTLYVIDYSLNQLQALDTATGAVQVIGSCLARSGESWSGMSGGLDGVMYAASTSASNSTLYTVNLATGAATEVGQITNAPAIIDIAMSPDMVLYGVDIVNDALVRIDPQTAAGTVIGFIGFDANYAQGMDFEEESGVLYLAAYNNGGELRTADLNTGATTLIGAFPGGAEVDAFAFATGGGQPECASDNECDDGLFCTGVETCDNGTCVASGDPCHGETSVCDEDNGECVECLTDGNCTEGQFCDEGTCRFPCELFVTYKEIRAEKLTKPRKVVLNVTSLDETFDIFGRIDLDPLTWKNVKFNGKKNRLRILAIVPAGLKPGSYPISVGDCSGEVVVTGTDR